MLTGVVLVGGSMRLRDVGPTLVEPEDNLSLKFSVFAMSGTTGDHLWDKVDHDIEEKVS